MIDWQWIPGTVLGLSAVGHGVWLRRSQKRSLGRFIFDAEDGFVGQMKQELRDQATHGLMLWPRPWLGDRPLTQVEQIIESGTTWLGGPLDPAEQQAQMLADTERLLDSYKPPGVDDAGDS